MEPGRRSDAEKRFAEEEDAISESSTQSTHKSKEQPNANATIEQANTRFHDAQHVRQKGTKTKREGKRLQPKTCNEGVGHRRPVCASATRGGVASRPDAAGPRFGPTLAHKTGRSMRGVST